MIPEVEITTMMMKLPEEKYSVSIVENVIRKCGSRKIESSQKDMVFLMFLCLSTFDARGARRARYISG